MGNVIFCGGKLGMSEPIKPPVEAVLYYNGDDPSCLTGGFRNDGYLVWVRDEESEDDSYFFLPKYDASGVTSAFSTKVIHLQGSGADGKDIRGYFVSNNKIDVTDIDSIEITFAFSGYINANSLDGTIALARDTEFEGHVGDFVKYSNTLRFVVSKAHGSFMNDKATTYTLDCSSVTGECYLVIALDCGDSGTRNMYVSKLVAHFKDN